MGSSNPCAQRYKMPVRTTAGWGLIVLAVTACGLPPEVTSTVTTERPVVYGQDSRYEYYAHPDPTLRARTLESTVALVQPSRFDMSNPADLRIQHRTLGDDESLCPGEPFAEQQVGASCSGTLVDWDLVLTAAHCVDDLAECQSRLFVFDLFYEGPGQLANIGPQDVFQCRRIVARRNVRDIDYALVQLDRPAAPPRRPAPVSQLDLPLTLGSSVSVVGFPDGIPAKLDSEGVVVVDGAPDLEAFEATVDTFGGNSGSGVYDAAGVLVGNLARGQTDYVRDGSCWVVNRLPAGGTQSGAEGVVYAARAIEGLCGTAGWRGPLCGDLDGTCQACASDVVCPQGWSCRSAAGDPAVTFCAAPCTTDPECPADHQCVNAGCEPREDPVCLGREVWSKNTCGREVAVLETCAGPAEVCEAGRCRGADVGNSCSDPVVLAPVDQVVTGSVGLGLSNEHEGSCGGAGPERVFIIDVDRPVRLQAMAEGYDTVLYLRTSCRLGSSERACSDDDDPPGGRGSALDVQLLPGPAYLFMDAYRRVQGDYVLTLDFTDLNPPDAGVPPDTGVEPDSGVPPDSGVAPDSGVELDAGVSEPDAGQPAPDAGAPVLAKQDEGCSCRDTVPPSPWASMAVLLGLWGVRRRRGRPR